MMISCKIASELLSKSLDRRLTWVERLQLRLHLAICGMCRTFAKQLAVLRQALKLNAKALELNTELKLSTQAKARISQLIDTTRNS